MASETLDLKNSANSVTPHSLDPLRAEEITRSVAILKEGLASRHVDPEQLRFVRCSILEPTKQQLAASEVTQSATPILLPWNPMPEYIIHA